MTWRTLCASSRCFTDETFRYPAGIRNFEIAGIYGSLEDIALLTAGITLRETVNEVTVNCSVSGRLLPVLMTAAMASAFASPPSIGDKAPDFALSTLQGTMVRLSEVLSPNPIVLVVLRGYPGYQCPLCNRQVQDFVQNAANFAAVSSRVILVYPGPADGLKVKAEEFAADKKLPENVELVLDPGYTFTDLYGLRWNAPKETAYPSTFVIDARGVIIFSKISSSHGGRTKASEILEVLRKKKQA